MSDDYEYALGGLRGHIVYGEQTAGDTPVEWMQVKVALPYLRGAERALIAERQRADAAEAEVARLRAIVAGRSDAPTDAEIDAHEAHGGHWLVSRVNARGDGTTRPMVLRLVARDDRLIASIPGTDYGDFWDSDPFSLMPGARWTPLDAAGEPMERGAR